MVGTCGRIVAAMVLCGSAALAACGVEDDTVAPPGPIGEPPEAGQPPPEETGEAERQMERAVFDLVNDERLERGLEALEWDDQLADLAREWSRGMAEEGRLEHQGVERMLERAEGFNGVGENIFRATGPVPASTVHVGWMRSDGHRANVLHPDFDRLGVGFLCTEDGAVWGTQRFGRTAGNGPPGAGGAGRDIPPEEPVVAEEGEGPSCPGALGDISIELE